MSTAIRVSVAVGDRITVVVDHWQSLGEVLATAPEAVLVAFSDRDGAHRECWIRCSDSTLMTAV